MSGPAPFARRARGSLARPALADRLREPGGASFAVRVRRASQVRTVADHVAADARRPVQPPAPPEVRQEPARTRAQPSPSRPAATVTPAAGTDGPTISYRRPQRAALRDDRPAPVTPPAKISTRHQPPAPPPTPAPPAGTAPTKPAEPSRMTPVTPPRPAAPPRPATPSSPATPSIPPTPPRPEAQVSVARESERRTVLDASSPVVSLSRDDLPRSGLVTVNVDWDRQRTDGGVWQTADVHLACLWQTVDGHSGLVHSDGMRSAPGFGARQVMRLGERNEDTGEVLSIDAKHLDVMARLLVVAVSRRNPPRWADIGVHVNLDLASGARVVVRTDDPPARLERARSVALASVHLVGGVAVVRREDDFVDGPVRQVALDYGWDDLDFVADGSALRT